MAALYVLDTNIFIAAIKGHPAVRQRLETTPLASLRLSAIVLGELEFGAEKSTQSERNRARVATIAQRLTLLGLNLPTCRCYATIRARLEHQGMPIGGNDLWIAAQAMAIGATLVTDNEREFRRIEELDIENWLADTTAP